MHTSHRTCIPRARKFRCERGRNRGAQTAGQGRFNFNCHLPGRYLSMIGEDRIAAEAETPTAPDSLGPRMSAPDQRECGPHCHVSSRVGRAAVGEPVSRGSFSSCVGNKKKNTNKTKQNKTKQRETLYQLLSAWPPKSCCSSGRHSPSGCTEHKRAGVGARSRSRFAASVRYLC
jgi:hypothetical protein